MALVVTVVPLHLPRTPQNPRGETPDGSSSFQTVRVLVQLQSGILFTALDGFLAFLALEYSVSMGSALEILIYTFGRTSRTYQSHTIYWLEELVGEVPPVFLLCFRVPGRTMIRFETHARRLRSAPLELLQSTYAILCRTPRKDWVAGLGWRGSESWRVLQTTAQIPKAVWFSKLKYKCNKPPM